MKGSVWVGLIFLLATFSCKKSSPNLEEPQEPTDTTVNTNLSKGADISWLSQMEAEGIKFYNNAGVQQDCIQILKDKGINAIRLRAWVHPSDGYNSTTDVLAKALRAKALGLKIMIDFHYSDTWADPSKQTKPAAWVSADFNGLKDSLYNYTVATMTTLKAGGIIPDWVQVGNETSNGMLWPDGKATDNMGNFAALVTAGCNAVKLVSPTSKVIVHLNNGHDNSLFRWIFDGLKTYNTPYDIIGMSLYPYWTSGGVNGWAAANSSCLANMNDMVTRYNKPVMVVEVGMPADETTACKNFLTDLITKVKSVNNRNGLGVFYWEPQCYNSWQGYGQGAFDNTGKPTIAMEAFK